MDSDRWCLGNLLDGQDCLVILPVVAEAVLIDMNVTVIRLYLFSRSQGPRSFSKLRH